MKHYTVQYTPPGSTLPEIVNVRADSAAEAIYSALLGAHDSFGTTIRLGKAGRASFKTRAGYAGTATPDTPTRYAV